MYCRQHWVNIGDVNSMSDKPAECPREGCYPFTAEGDFWIWFNTCDVQIGFTHWVKQAILPYENPIAPYLGMAGRGWPRTSWDSTGCRHWDYS